MGDAFSVPFILSWWWSISHEGTVTVTGPRNSVRAVTVSLQRLASLSKYIKLLKHQPEQLWPFPLYSGLQLQLKEPLVLMQMALLLQL